MVPPWVDAPTGTLIAYATAPGRVASDGTGENGLYTSELLKQMRVPGLSATDMFMRVRAEVIKQTGNKQVPWEASSLVGAFYFTAPKSTGTSTAPANESNDSAAFELSYWETIKTSNDPEDFKAYLAKYPDGQFAGLAKNRIRNLATATTTNGTGTADRQPSLPSTSNITSGGVLNGKATLLVQPTYPPVASAVRASGEVVVQVLIDENGTVISAQAVSGHPLLKAASEAAARASKFSPTTLSGQPVKVRGSIVYNFVLPTPKK